MKDNDRAFPVFEEARRHSDGSSCTDYISTSAGMTLTQYAAIQLRVPRSGDPELDAMIRESRRADFAGQMLAGTVDWMDSSVEQNSAKEAFSAADALLAEWEKEAGNEK
jgi:hypothetical protein